MDFLKDLIPEEIYTSLVGKSYEDALKVIVDTVGEDAWAEVTANVDDETIKNSVSLATGEAVIVGDETLNSEKSEEKVEEEEKEASVDEDGTTEEGEKPAEDSASEDDETPTDSSDVEDVVVEETSSEGTVDTVDTDASENDAIDPVYVEGLENRIKELEGLLHNAIVDTAIEIEANKAGCIDVDDIKRFIDTTTVEVVDGKASGVGEMIADLKKQKGYLFTATKSKGSSGGFNPAKPVSALDGVSAKFYELNPNLR